MKSNIKIKGKKFYSNFRGLDQKAKEWAIGLNVKGHPDLSPKAAETAASIIAGAWKEALKGLISRKQAEDRIKSLSNLPPIVMLKALDRVKMVSLVDNFSNMPSIRQYLEDFKRNASPKSEAQRRAAIKLLLAFLGDEADKRLDFLSPEMCRSFCRSRLLSVTVGSVNREVGFLSPAFSQALSDGLLSRNPFASIDLQSMNRSVNPELGEDKTKREPFTEGEMRMLLTAIASPWREMVTISYFTGGQRIGDCACLRWSSVDFDANVISFSTGKTGRFINCPMVEPLRQCLLSLNECVPNSVFVFPDLESRYQRSRGCLSVEFTAILKALGITGKRNLEPLKGKRRNVSSKSFHSIRHTVVTALRSSGAVTQDVAREIVGHDSEEVERQYFAASAEMKLKGLRHLEEYANN